MAPGQHTTTCALHSVNRGLQVVSLHCALDEKTTHLINRERLGMMKEDAVLVNAARGPVVDEVALVEHLKANPNFRRAAPAALAALSRTKQHIETLFGKADVCSCYAIPSGLPQLHHLAFGTC